MAQRKAPKAKPAPPAVKLPRLKGKDLRAIKKWLAHETITVSNNPDIAGIFVVVTRRDGVGTFFSASSSHPLRVMEAHADTISSIARQYLREILAAQIQAHEK